LTTVTLNGRALMSPIITFERLRILVPEFVPAVIVIIAKIPWSDTDWPLPRTTSATPVTVPTVLFIVPGIK
jgi:hypothetical protein